MRSATRSSPASSFGRLSPNISAVMTITRATFLQDVAVTDRIASSICESLKAFIIYAALKLTHYRASIQYRSYSHRTSSEASYTLPRTPGGLWVVGLQSAEIGRASCRE